MCCAFFGLVNKLLIPILNVIYTLIIYQNLKV